MKIFKTTKTIRKELRWYLLGLIVLLVFFYTILLEEYFIRGINMSTKIEFELIAAEYNKKRLTNPKVPLPQQTYLYTYINWSTVATEFKTLFPKDNHQSNKLISIDRVENKNKESTQFVFMRYLLNDNNFLYMFGKYPPEMLNQQQTNEFRDTVFITFPLAMLFIVAAVLLIYRLGRRIGRSTDALNDWAEKLSLESIKQERPDFHYSELNGVADRLQEAFHRIGSLLEKEHIFLRFTSHELRTPLAITRANVELLEKQGITQKYEQAIARIKRANTGMQHITEALLWLSRDTEDLPNSELIEVDNVLADIINDHCYLLRNKKVDIEIEKSTHKIKVPLVLFKIIMSNLIRNAFQYTSDGFFSVTMQENKIILLNKSFKCNDSQKFDKDDSFGLGLILVKRLTEKLGWNFTYQLITGGRIVSVKIKNY